MPTNGWIGVDFDGTLVTHKFPKTGEPIWPIINRVKDWLAQGQEVRIFTARVSGDNKLEQMHLIRDWCEQFLGKKLQVTCFKDYDCIAIYDDRAIQVEKDTGRLIRDCSRCRWTHITANHDNLEPF